MEIRRKCYEVEELDPKRYFIDALYHLYKELKFGSPYSAVLHSTYYLGMIAAGLFKNSSDPKLHEYIIELSRIGKTVGEGSHD